MEILFIWRRLTPPFVLGGAEVSARILATCLLARGYRVSFLGSYPAGREPAKIIADLQERGRTLDIAIEVGPENAIAYSLSGIECLLVPERTFLEDLATRLQEHPPGLVIPVILGPPGVAACHAQNVPTVAWIHDLSHNSWASLFAPHKAALFCSDFLRRQCLLLTGKDGHVLYPPFEEPAPMPESPRDSVTLINDIAVKGSWIIRRLALEFPEKKFIAIQSSRVSEFRRGDPPPNLTVMPGRQDLAPVWQRTRVLLVPSMVVEGFGRVAVEAGLHGIPAIAFERGGLTEAVGDGGILIQEDAIEPWVKALRELDDETRWTQLSQKALHHARSFLGDPVDKLIEWGVLPGDQSSSV